MSVNQPNHLQYVYCRQLHNWIINHTWWRNTNIWHRLTYTFVDVWECVQEILEIQVAFFNFLNNQKEDDHLILKGYRVTYKLIRKGLIIYIQAYLGQEIYCMLFRLCIFFRYLIFPWLDWKGVMHICSCKQ